MARWEERTAKEPEVGVEAELDHVVLEVRDAEAAAGFYQELLGFAPVRLEAFRAGEAPFPSARVSAGTLIDFFPPGMWGNQGGPTNPNHICFTVSQAEAEALEKQLAARAIAIEQTLERSFGARGIGRSVYFRDPESNLLEVRYYAGEG